MFDAVSDYNMLNLNCKKCTRNVAHSGGDCKKTHDRKSIGYDVLGIESSKVLKKSSMGKVVSVNNAYDKSMCLQVISDDDNDYSACFEELT